MQKERIKIKTIIFDLDDTLIKTSRLYDRARDEFSSLMQELGFNSEESLSKLDEVDISYIKEYGFVKERYPLSLGKTYEYFCKINGEKINPVLKKKIEDIGWQVFRQIPELVDGVYQILDTLRKKYFLILATLGDPQVQDEKVQLSGLKFCKINGEKINPVLKKKIEDIGWQVFRQIPELVDGVYQILDTLRKKYFLILATLGDPQVQKEKVQLSGLKKYFSEIYVLKHKNVEEYKNILKEHNLDKKNTWIIGNSVRSDLNPGLKLGINCILIPYLSWKFEEEEPLSENYLRLNSLEEVLNYL